MTLKDVAKVKGNLACGLKNDKQDFAHFMQAFSFSLWLDSFVQSVERFQWKRTEKLFLMTLKSGAKFEEKMTLGFKNYMRNLVSFIASNSKCKYFHFDALLLSIVYKVSAKRVYKIHLLWRWKKIQILNKSWLFFWKMAWGIW